MSPSSRLMRWATGVVPAVVAVCVLAPWLVPVRERVWGDTTYYAAIALKAAREGHWWTLSQGETPYFNKPPLVFWMHSIASLIGGTSPWAVLVPQVLLLALTSALIGVCAWRLSRRPELGVLAGTLLATSPEWIVRASRFRLEPTLVLCMFAGAWLLVEALRASTKSACRWRAIGAGVCLGLGLLVKPFISLGAIPVALAFVLMTREPAGRDDSQVRVRTLLLAVGLCLLTALAVATPWHASMVAQHGSAFVNQYFWVTSVSRATGAEFSPEPWHWYAGYLLSPHDLPRFTHTWMLLVGALALVGAWSAVVHRNPLARFGLVWAVIWTIALSTFADKRGYYFMLVTPGLCLLGAAGVSAILDLIAQRRTSATSHDHPRLARTAVSFAVILLAGLTTLASVRWASTDPSAPAPALVELADALNADPALAGPLVSGNLKYNDGAYVYVHTGRWPRTMGDKTPVPREQARAGELFLFDLARPAATDPRDQTIRTLTGYVLARPSTPGK